MRKNNQTGRSMVEMLGVLAIIGVLSVGAIAGYQKAMFKYKLNKQAQQVSQVINAVARYSRSFDDISRTLTTSRVSTDILIKLGEIPKEMIKPYDSKQVYDVFNTALDLYLYPSDKKRVLVHIYPELTKKVGVI